MERLTSNSPLTEFDAMNLSVTNLYERLKEYEDTGLEPEEIEHRLKNERHWATIWMAEADDRLLVLPCKVGDTVYAIKNREIYATAVIGFRVHEWTGLWVLLLFDERKTNGSYELRIDDFGKTVFLTREEAEAVLRGGADG